jgi:hypothetical protein
LKQAATHAAVLNGVVVNVDIVGGAVAAQRLK